MFIATLFTTDKDWKQLKCLPMDKWIQILIQIEIDVHIDIDVHIHIDIDKILALKKGNFLVSNTINPLQHSLLTTP